MASLVSSIAQAHSKPAASTRQAQSLGIAVAFALAGAGGLAGDFLPAGALQAACYTRSSIGLIAGGVLFANLLRGSSGGRQP